MQPSSTPPVAAPPVAALDPSLLRARFEGGVSIEAFLPTAQKNAELWQAVYKQARVPEGLAARARALGGRWHLLVLSEDWCGDAVNTVPYVARLAEVAPDVDVRLLARDQHLDLMDAHLSPTGGRAIPVVIVLDAHFREHGWWGSRPAPLQAWVLGPEGQALPKDERYRELRRWYARDRGATTLEEIVALLERAAGVAGG